MACRCAANCEPSRAGTNGRRHLSSLTPRRPPCPVVISVRTLLRCGEAFALVFKFEKMWALDHRGLIEQNWPFHLANTSFRGSTALARFLFSCLCFHGE